MVYVIQYLFIPKGQTVVNPQVYEGSYPVWGLTAAQALVNSGIHEVLGTGLDAVQITGVYPANPSSFVV